MMINMLILSLFIWVPLFFFFFFFLWMEGDYDNSNTRNPLKLLNKPRKTLTNWCNGLALVWNCLHIIFYLRAFYFSIGHTHPGGSKTYFSPKNMSICISLRREHIRRSIPYIKEGVRGANEISWWEIKTRRGIEGREKHHRRRGWYYGEGIDNTGFFGGTRMAQ